MTNRTGVKDKRMFYQMVQTSPSRKSFKTGIGYCKMSANDKLSDALATSVKSDIKICFKA